MVLVVPAAINLWALVDGGRGVGSFRQLEHICMLFNFLVRQNKIKTRIRS